MHITSRKIFEGLYSYNVKYADERALGSATIAIEKFSDCTALQEAQEVFGEIDPSQVIAEVLDFYPHGLATAQEEAHMRNGNGKLLLDQIVKDARERGALFIYVASLTQAGSNFCDKYGYVPKEDAYAKFLWIPTYQFSS